MRFDGTRGFQQAVEQFRAFATACRKLFVGLLVGFAQLMKFIRDVKGGENRDLSGIDSERAGRDFTHSPIDVLGQLLQVFRVTVRAYGVSLIIDFDLYRW